MNRRAFLHGVCGSLVAVSGCLDAATDTSFVTNRSIEVTDRGCGNRRNTGTLDYDESNDQLRIEGRLAGTTKCGGLNLSYAYNEQSHRVIVEVIPDDTTQCPSCTRYYDYDATVSFRETPSVVVGFHSDPEILEGIGTVILETDASGTNTTSQQ